MLLEAKSGRDFVQKMQLTFQLFTLSVTLFFKSLGSSRRMKLTCDVAERVRQTVDKEIKNAYGADPLAAHPELNGYAVYATDGHTHAACAHEPVRYDKKYPVTSIYSINLRTHSAKYNRLTSRPTVTVWISMHGQTGRFALLRLRINRETPGLFILITSRHGERNRLIQPATMAHSPMHRMA